jgi:hypothetical protein
MAKMTIHKTFSQARHGGVHHNSVLERLKQEDCEFKASLGYLVRPCLKTTTKKKIPLAKSSLEN